MKKYYKRAIGHLEGATRLLIFGPGEAKTEFEKEINQIKKFRGRVVCVESADKMTGRQIITRVKDFFSKEIE